MKFRPTTIAGAGIYSLSVMIIVMIYTKPELAESDLFKSLAQAIIIQGLIGLAMAFYFTAKSLDRVQPKPDEPEAIHEGDTVTLEKEAGE